jgi:hypothetical protein
VFGSGTVAYPNKPFLIELLVTFSKVKIPLLASIVSVNKTKISMLDLTTKDLEQFSGQRHALRLFN